MCLNVVGGQSEIIKHLCSRDVTVFIFLEYVSIMLGESRETLAMEADLNELNKLANTAFQVRCFTKFI